MTLDDLKRAIESYETIANDFLAKQAGGVGYAMGKQHARAEAWRTAFEWRAEFHGTGLGNLSLERYQEFKEGMALIREKLS